LVGAKAVGTRWWFVASCIVLICVTLALPTRRADIVGGRATALVVPTEAPGTPHGHFLLLTAEVRRATVAEIIWNHVRSVAATAQPGSMDESRSMAWAAVSEIVGPILHVDAVDSASPAALAGIEPGDQIVSVNGTPASSFGVNEALAAGHIIVVRIVRAGAPRDLTIRPAPPWPQPAVGGLTVHVAPLDGAPPSVDVGDASGSSGGLVLALEFLDIVTPGDLTGRKTIAATGEVGPGGQVVGVLGYQEKIAAARRAGATVAIVPQGAGVTAPDGVTLLETSDVRTALGELCVLGGVSSACGNAAFDPGRV
jgi:membrane-associated protease RseP (regulator of RpoE activity)